jgi:uncharacterized protein (TIGR03663 family)
MQNQDKPSFFDRPLVEPLKPNWEKAIYLGIFLVAVVSRFWDLGARAMSHDESLHALYSYYLYNGTGYQHNPMMHGPFLFHANALIYFLFGDGDYTARIMPALFGVFLVMSPLLLRRWLDRLGAIIASILLLISPSILYYSRYIRNDVYIAVWTILLITALFQFMRTRKPGWFLLGAAVLMLSLATKENAYIFGFIGLAFVVEMILWERISRSNQLWLYVGGAALAVVLLGIGYVLNRPPAEGAQAAAEASNSMKLVAAMVIVVGGTIPVVLLSASLLRSRNPQRSRIEEAIRSLSWQWWLIAAITVFVIYTLLFTTFFTNPSGLLTGVFGSISYWLAQQEVQRGGQPWYYYFLVLTMYEFVPFLFSLIAIVYYLIRGVPASAGADEESLEAEEATGGTGEEAGAESVPLRQRRGEQDTPVPASPPAGAEQPLFVAFLIFWTVSTLLIYSWAGEKMPWLVVHPVLPMIILTAKFAGDLFSRVNWHEVWQRGGALLALLLPITLFGLYTLLTKQPLQGLSLSKLQETGQWFAALLVTLLLLVLTGLLVRRLGGRRAFHVGVGTALVVLSFLTVRFAWMASYINYDYATELLVYAHGGPDVKPTMAEIADISARTVGDKQINVAYDNEVSWPLEWYMREYPNRVYYGDTPTREKLDVPVVLVSERNDAKVQPFLGDRYYRFKRRLVWWPNQQYMGLTWERIRNIVTSPDKRKILWDILYWRKYPRSTDDWYHVHNFYLYVRKDVAQQIWNFGAAPPEAVELAPDPYVEKHIDLSSERVWGEVGTGPGQFNHPRGIALGPDGNVYVVDSDNYRIQVFGPDGTFLREWGSQCNLEDGHGCVDPDGSGPLASGDGQFQEPWGIAVAPDGRVYVADTWNHRIQVFDSNGAFLTKWGQYGQTDSPVALFYGPRDVAVDSSGRVFVTDTGNKRVVVFDQDGNLLYQWGGGGVLGGYFEEPVGIDTGTDGTIYVADTWNQRVQVFDGDYVYLRDWPVAAWYGQSVVNKPYLAVDSQDRVYITDPEGYLVAVYSATGDLLATFGSFGYDQNSFSLPTGIAVSDAGYIYVTDTDGQRVIEFQPVP